MGFIIANTFVMSMNYFGMDDDFRTALEVLNFIFAMVFNIECVIKLTALGPKGYFGDGHHLKEATGPHGCKLCLLGHYCGAEAISLPAPCRPGTHMPVEGAASNASCLPVRARHRSAPLSRQTHDARTRALARAPVRARNLWRTRRQRRRAVPKLRRRQVHSTRWADSMHRLSGGWLLR